MPRYPSGDDWRKVDDDYLSQRYQTLACRLVNQTKHTWYWEGFRLQTWTNFRKHPTRDEEIKQEIRPGDSTEIWLMAQRLAIGVEAWLTYKTEAGFLEFHWNVPHVGSNTFDATQLPVEFLSFVNTATEFLATNTDGDHFVDGKYGRKLSGRNPEFEWTIKERELEAMVAEGRTVLQRPVRPDHFYSLRPREVVDEAGCSFEGICGYVYPTEQPNTVPFHRFLYPGGDHFYTQSVSAEGEAECVFVQIECYLPSSRDNGATALYRWYGNGDHFYSADPHGQGAVANGYELQGEAGFIFPTQMADTVPLFQWLRA